MNPVVKPQVVLVTGCSSGFGLLTCAHLASKGHHVVATMRNMNKSPALLNAVKDKGGVVDLFHLDVTDKKSIAETIRTIGDKYGHIDVLVNNAGYGLGGFFEDLSDDEIRAQFETNFFGVQNVTREALKLMRPRRKGKIINISSLAGLSASPCFSAYNASKFALEGFSESLRYELKFLGIQVILIEPGLYRTRIFYENARYGRDFHNPDSPYYSLSTYLEERSRRNADTCGKDPNAIALLVESIMLDPNPAFRNFPDWQSRMVYSLRRILPFRLYSSLVDLSIFHGLETRP